MSETDQLVEKFIARTLPKPEWTHHAHLRVGVWHVVSYGPEKALPLLRERISRYNESVGTVNSDDSGYHETVTAFYVKAIAAAIADQDPASPLDALATLVIDRIGARDFPLRYYSKERLFSVAARRGWVEPDLRKVPKVPSAKGAKGSVPTVPEVPKG
jgi:hypothetical protein